MWCNVRNNFRKNTMNITYKNIASNYNFNGNYFHKPIKRFQQVDNYLYRGAKPDKIHMLQLKKMGIDTIVDFTINYVLKTESRKEYKMAKNLGIEYINLPFPAFNNPDKDYLDKFFNIMDDARKNNKKVYIHCAQGKDRTGLFAAMYKLRYGLDDVNGAIDEMLKIGHNAKSYPNLIRYLKIYNKAITKNPPQDLNAVLGKAKVLMDKNCSSQ